MNRNSSKSVSAPSINTTNKDASNMSNVALMVRPVTATLDASDTVKLSDLTTSEIMEALKSTNEEAFEAFVSNVGQGESRTAVEACYYPVADTISGGYSLDSVLNGPVSTPKYGIQTSAWRAAVWKGDFDAMTSTCIYNPEYSPATPHVIKPATLPTPPVEIDLLAPYTGKQVVLSYRIGTDEKTGDVIEWGIDTVMGETAREEAIKATKRNGLPVLIKCVETGAVIYMQCAMKGAKSTAVRATSTGVKVSKGATPEEIAAREEAARVKAETARLKAEEEAAAKERAKAEKAAAKERERQAAINAKNAQKALKATRTSPDADDHNIHAFTLLKAEEGATCKELNLNDDEVRGNEYGTCNDGWKQKAGRFALAWNHRLYQSARPCKRSPSKIDPMPVFKLVPKGEDAGIGWWDITPSK